MRFFLSFLLILATTAFSVQLYRLLRQMSELEAEITKITRQVQPIDRENQKLKADLEYFLNADRLENELRKSGYAKPDEKMLIIIPQQP